MVLHSISFSSKILSLSKTLPFSFQCHSLLYADGGCYSGRKKILLTYPNWNSQGFIISYSNLYAKQASNFVEYLPAYLAHSHGEDIYHWFTPDAVNEAKAMGWDEESNN